MENLVTIKTFFEPTDLLIPRSLLESEGIECFAKDEYMTRLHPGTGVVGGIKLQVRESDVNQAVDVLMKGGFLTEEDMKPDGFYEYIGKILEKLRKK